MIDIDDFVENFAGQFDETPPDAFTADTVFRDVDEWSSLTALSIIAMVDEEYGVTIKGDDIKNSSTIRDLYNIVSSKK